MTAPNRYDVTEWPGGDPYDDIGAVIKRIVKRRAWDRVIRNRYYAVLICDCSDFSGICNRNLRI